MKKLSKAQSEALYYIELDGGLVRTIGQEWPYTTVKGRPINAITAQWLVDHHKLIAHQDGFIEGMSQSWSVAHPIGLSPAVKGEDNAG